MIDIIVKLIIWLRITCVMFVHIRHKKWSIVNPKVKGAFKMTGYSIGLQVEQRCLA